MNNLLKLIRYVVILGLLLLFPFKSKSENYLLLQRIEVIESMKLNTKSKTLSSRAFYVKTNHVGYTNASSEIENRLRLSINKNQTISAQQDKENLKLRDYQEVIGVNISPFYELHYIDSNELLFLEYNEFLIKCTLRNDSLFIEDTLQIPANRNDIQIDIITNNIYYATDSGIYSLYDKDSLVVDLQNVQAFYFDTDKENCKGGAITKSNELFRVDTLGRKHIVSPSPSLLNKICKKNWAKLENIWNYVESHSIWAGVFTSIILSILGYFRRKVIKTILHRIWERFKKKTNIDFADYPKHLKPDIFKNYGLYYGCNKSVQNRIPPNLSCKVDGKFNKFIEFKIPRNCYFDYLFENQGIPKKASNIEYVISQTNESTLYFIIKVMTSSREASEKMYLKIREGNSNPEKHRDGKHEQVVYLEPKEQIREWKIYKANVKKLTKQTFGKDGWKLYKLVGIRVRGTMSIAQIKIY
jgi:hypothetical protein